MNLQNPPSFGAWLQTGSPEVAEILSVMGFDWLCVDLEHGSIGVAQLPNIFRAVNKRASPVVRVPKPDAVLIRRCLDAGAEGIIVADVREGAQVERAKEAMFRAPVGERGFGYSRANKYCQAFSPRSEVDPILVCR